ncbi:MAG TPA: hypothetical protein VM925_13730 [Labilithrix sp.]|nr:hypothetical protein [Labilithrix sp.]
MLWTADAAAARSARLVYVRGAGAESCPDEGAVRTAVAARLGYDPFVAYAETTVFAHVERDGDGFRTDVGLVDGAGLERGGRQLKTQDRECGDVIGAMALTISIAIDPLSLSAPAPTSRSASAESPQLPPDTAASSSPPTAPPAPSPPSREAPPVQPSTERRIGFFAGGGVLGAVGMGPALAVGGSVFGGARWRALSVEIEGRGDLPSSAASSQGGRVQSSTLLGMFVPCVRLAIPYACAVGAVGQLRASSVGVTAPRDASALYTGVGARLGAAIPVTSSLEARVYGDVLAPLDRRSLTVNGVDVFWFAPVSANLNFALSVRFR